MTNLGAIDDHTTMGPATGDLRGVVSATTSRSLGGPAVDQRAVDGDPGTGSQDRRSKRLPGCCRLRVIVRAGSTWLLRHQNSDGGWGDTVRSRSNISTTAIVRAMLSHMAAHDADVTSAVDRSAEWLRRAAGEISALRTAILKERTFSVPILTVLALTNSLEKTSLRAGGPRAVGRDATGKRLLSRSDATD